MLVGSRKEDRRVVPQASRSARTTGMNVAAARRCLLGVRRGDLDQIAARVVEDSSADDAHVGGWLSESHTESGQALVLGFDVVDGELREGDSISSERVFERFTAGWPLGCSASSVPSGSCGETTVSQRSAPTGTSCFLVKPSFSV